MRHGWLRRWLVVGAGVALAACGSDPLDRSGDGSEGALASIRLPPGFAIDIWVEGVPRVRSLALGDDGTVYAGTYPHTAGVTGPVYAFRDSTGDGRVDGIWVLRNGFRNPNGVACLDGLFVVDEDIVQRIPDVATSLDAAPVGPSVTRFYDIPSGELNRAPRAGLHFGFPYDHAALPDPLLCGQAPVVTPPEHQFAAHTARYTRRPVDLLVLPDGSVLVSDDRGGVIYRISYRMP